MINDPFVRGTTEFREEQAKRYAAARALNRRHVVVCRHCTNEVAITRQDARTGVCTNCLRRGKR